MDERPLGTDVETLEARLWDVEQALREARTPDVRALLREVRDAHLARLASLRQDGVVDLVPASSRTPAQLAALFTAGYEGYYLPVAVDEATFAFMAGSWDYDLEASLVAVEDGEDVGFCLLGVRGEEGWIGGVGVVAPRRGQGIGRRLMDAVEERARALGLRRLWLEVLVQNEPALALYEKLGYARVRELEVWSLDRLVFQKHKARSVPAAAAQERIRAARKEREPWQRADETVAKLEGLEGLANDGAAVVFRIAGERVSLLQAVADDAAAAREILQAFPAAATSLGWLNGPAGHPVNAAIAGLGGTLGARQHELVLEL